ncbi:hypothetical protein ACF0H5_004963 [Mactra antiquata]
MGAGSSVQPSVGVLPNPRAQFAKEQSKKVKKECRIGAPVLIDLHHGSVRYREVEESKKLKKEIPYEGEATHNKGHYFYHPRLNDFSEKANRDREDPEKFLYVVKGPNSAKQKKVFYVYGRGLDALDGKRTLPSATRAMGQDPTWPQRQNPNDVYYNLTFTSKIPSDDPIPGIPNRHHMQFAMSNTDTVEELRKKVALTIVKSAANVYLCYQYNVIEAGKVLGELSSKDQVPEMFGVNLSLMEH